MRNQYVIVRILTDKYDLSDRTIQTEIERLILGYGSKIEHDYILEVEVCNEES